MFNVTASHSPKHFLLEDLVFIRTFPWWQQGYFDRSWNLSTNLSQSSIPCSTYLQQRRGGIISNLTKVNLFSYNNQVLFGVISQCSRHPAPSQKESFPLSFTLAKKIIDLDTQLKEELTDLFGKLLGRFLFPQGEKKVNDEHFANG